MPTRFAIAAWVVFAVPSAVTPSLADDTFSELDVKAAYVTNFAKLVEWPAVAGENQKELPICTLSEIRLSAPLRRMAAGQIAGGRTIRVRVDTRPDAAHCRLLVLDSEQYRSAALVLRSLRDKPVLTVGDGDGFIDVGGAFQLVVKGSRVLFDANVPALRAAGLDVSARLLRLARNLVQEDASAR